jgi:hypothetical protein
MGSFSPDWTLPSRLTKNPLMWMLKVNGLLVDVRRAPLELQRMAFEKGLIPFIPPSSRNRRDELNTDAVPGDKWPRVHPEASLRVEVNRRRSRRRPGSRSSSAARPTHE